MELFLGALAWCAGAGLFTVAMQWISRANPGEKLPFLGHPTRTPGRAVVPLALSIVLLIAFFVTWSDVVGRNWALGVYMMAVIPAAVIMVRHNRAVRG